MAQTAETRLETPWGPLTLCRWPRVGQDPLQAWDGADRLALALLETQRPTGRIWTLNDDWGALSLSLAKAGVPVTAMQDSHCGQRGLIANAADNALVAPALSGLFEAPAEPPELVIVRVPKDLALLKWQLGWVAASCPAGTRVWVCGLDRHLPAQLKPALEAGLHDLQTAPGKFKAHVFMGTTRPASVPPWPWRQQALPGSGYPLWTLPGVFAASGIDPGGRLLLEHCRQEDREMAVVDLGCGSGMLGLRALEASPGSRVLFCDDSALALAAVRQNVAERGLAPARVEYHQGDGLEGLAWPADRVLLNPPFHAGHTLETRTGYRLVSQAAEALKPGGELLMVFNRHLDYRPVLRRAFGGWQELAQNRSFRVVRAEKR